MARPCVPEAGLQDSVWSSTSVPGTALWRSHFSSQASFSFHFQRIAQWRQWIEYHWVSCKGSHLTVFMAFGFISIYDSLYFQAGFPLLTLVILPPVVVYSSEWTLDQCSIVKQTLWILYSNYIVLYYIILLYLRHRTVVTTDLIPAIKWTTLKVDFILLCNKPLSFETAVRFSWFPGKTIKRQISQSSFLWAPSFS